MKKQEKLNRKNLRNKKLSEEGGKIKAQKGERKKRTVFGVLLKEVLRSQQ